MRARGGQFAGFAGAVLALAGANVGSILGSLDGGARDCAGGSLLVGVLLLVFSLVIVLRGAVLLESVSVISANEVGNYVTGRFIAEPEKVRPKSSPEPIPWDVPLDKTKPKFHRYGDTTSV